MYNKLFIVLSSLILLKNGKLHLSSSSCSIVGVPFELNLFVPFRRRFCPTTLPGVMLDIGCDTVSFGSIKVRELVSTLLKLYTRVEDADTVDLLVFHPELHKIGYIRHLF